MVTDLPHMLIISAGNSVQHYLMRSIQRKQLALVFFMLHFDVSQQGRYFTGNLWCFTGKKQPIA